MPTLPRLLGFGASTMQGVGDPAGGFLRRLGDLLAAAGRPHAMVNHGIGGNTTRDMLARLDRSRAELPARTVVLLGCNDLPRARDGRPQMRTALPAYAANLRAILAGLAGPGAIFVTSFAVCPRRCGVADADLGAYMAEARGIAAAHGYAVWDLFSESLGWQGRYWAEDGVHFNGDGHALIAARIAGMLA